MIMRNRWIGILLVGLLAIASPWSRATEPEPLPGDAPVDTVLDALDQTGKQLTSFTAKLTDSSGDPSLGNVTQRTGKIWFAHSPEGSDRVHVVFDLRISGKLGIPEKREYLLEGIWLTDRDYDKKIEAKHQVLKPGEKADLLKLGGPFPLPIGQDKKDVHKLFDVKIIATDKGDPANTIHLQLSPKAGSDLAKKFSTIDTWVDRTLRMPVRVDTTSADGNSPPHEIDLTDMKINSTKLGDADFALPAIDKSTWNLQTDELGK